MTNGKESSGESLVSISRAVPEILNGHFWRRTAGRSNRAPRHRRRSRQKRVRASLAPRHEGKTFTVRLCYAIFQRYRFAIKMVTFVRFSTLHFFVFSAFRMEKIGVWSEQEGKNTKVSAKQQLDFFMKLLFDNNTCICVINAN